MSLLFNDILTDCSYVLVEKLANTTFGTAIPAGFAVVTPGSMSGIYPGATLIAGAGASVELITVVATTPTTFSAVFVNAHLASDPIYGATFPSGQVQAAPLFSQSEMIAYLTEVQNDFLLKVRPVYGIAIQDTVTAQGTYAQPGDAIRLERIAINPDPSGDGVTMDLYETSQASLDMSDPYWQGVMGTPAQWFRDKVDTGNFGLTPLPSAVYTMEQWYSMRGASTGNTLLTPLLVLDVFRQFMAFGVLARCFSKDGDTMDPQRAQYFQKRYDMGVLISSKFMTGAGVTMDQGFRGDPDFSPMPVAQQAANA